jgi:hypothetical protein
MVVYHGSIVEVKAPLAYVGRQNLDFGKGFYVTDLKEQAISWASRPFNANKTKILNVYNFDKEQLLLSEFHYLHFDSYNDEWLDFVVGNRSGKMLWKPYDIVEGGIANDRIFNTIELYISELISKEEALKRLQSEQPNNQICILNQHIIDNFLHFVESFEIRKEDLL